jgi:hypothetical protein
VEAQNAEKSAGLLHAAGGSPTPTMLGSTRYRDTAISAADQADPIGQVDAMGLTPQAVAEVEEFLLDEIFHDLSLISLYTTSALEAARRGDRDELRLRLRVQLRDCFRHAVELHDLLSPVQPKKGGS